MKNVCLKIGLIALALALVFGVVLVVLSVKKGAAEHHYDHNQETKKFEYTYTTYLYYGCGDKDCKYCNGERHYIRYNSSDDDIGLTIQYGRRIQKSTITKEERELFREFYYYHTIFVFWIASIVLTAVCGVTAGVTIPLHFKREKARRSDRENY